VGVLRVYCSFNFEINVRYVCLIHSTSEEESDDYVKIECKGQADGCKWKSQRDDQHALFACQYHLGMC